MPLVELRCPTCHAPLAASAHDSTVECRYCGASLHDAAAAKAPAQTRTVFALSMDRVGHSNRSRVAQVLQAVAGIAAPEADRLVDSAPCELVVWEEESRATELRMALIEAGVVARIEPREVQVPPPVMLPDRAVHLSAVGADKVAVMKVVRAHLDLGMAEAKRLVERAPCVLVDALEGARAAALVAALLEAGAEARASE